MSEHVEIVDTGEDPQARAAGLGVSSPRELAFRTGAPALPVEPTRRVSLVPGRPRALPWRAWSRSVIGRSRAP
jgi:hypothetical protein